MKKVVKGQTFKPKATTWNSFVDAAVYVKGRQSDLTSKALRRDTKSGIVLVRNSTDEDLGQFSVIQLGDLVIKPSNNEQEFRANLPVFNPATEDMKDRPLVITQKPLKQNEVGPAMISGITPGRINIENEAHQYAEATSNGLKSSSSGSIQILWKEEDTGENKWAILLLGASGSGDTYDGYFKAVNSSEEETQKVKITSGYSVINNKSAFNVLDNELTDDDGSTFAAELTITAKAYVYLQATYDANSKTVNEPTIEQSANFPLPEPNAFKGLIAVIEWDDENGTISKITQQRYGVIEGIIAGTC
jgi:hypothetical protein